MFYSFNGVNLAKESLNTLGASILRAGTAQLGGVNNQITPIRVPGRDGYIQAPKTRAEQTLVFNIAVPREHVEALIALLAHTGTNASFPTLGELKVSTTANQAAYYELVSAIPSSQFPNDRRVTVTATINIPQGAWRDINTTTQTRAITLNPQTVTLASGISLPVPDADIFIEGDVGTMQIVDVGSGAWLRTTSNYNYVAGQGLYFQGATGRAFRAATSSPWTPIQDIGFAVDTSGTGFKMTPYFNPLTPETRGAQLQVISLNLSSISVQVRYRGAYVMK